MRQLTCEAAQAKPMPSKDKDIFYLKLQWISAKDESEKQKLAEQIKRLLAEKSSSK